jgi:protein gp37
MSDLFYRSVPGRFIDHVFNIMEPAGWHTFQVLTKRSSLMRDYLKRRYCGTTPPQHVWLGVSVEDGRSRARINHLRQMPAAVRFLSVEPLIGPLGVVDLLGIHWVIAGGESGPGARPMHVDWAREARNQCATQGVAFFFKQWGGIRPKSGVDRWTSRVERAAGRVARSGRRLMSFSAEHYAGREQALVKHHFLKDYLESLANKIASRRLKKDLARP